MYISPCDNPDNTPVVSPFTGTAAEDTPLPPIPNVVNVFQGPGWEKAQAALSEVDRRAEERRVQVCSIGM